MNGILPTERSCRAQLESWTDRNSLYLIQRCRTNPESARAGRQIGLQLLATRFRVLTARGVRSDYMACMEKKSTDGRCICTNRSTIIFTTGALQEVLPQE